MIDSNIEDVITFETAMSPKDMKTIFQLQVERDNWKRIALFLADCHAGTAAYDGNNAKTDRWRRKRLRDIARMTATLLEKGKLDDHMVVSDVKDTAERCRKAARKQRTGTV